MNKVLNDVFTNCVMNKWGDIFELDRDKVSSGFNRFTDSDFVANDIRFNTWARYLPNLVPAMLMSDKLLSYLADTVNKDEPVGLNEHELARSYLCMSNLGKPFHINFNEFDESLWRSFLDKMDEGFKADIDFIRYQELLIKDISKVQFDLVQYVLNNIGIVLYHASECPPFDNMITCHTEKYRQNIIHWYNSEWRPKYDAENLRREIEEAEAAAGYFLIDDNDE